MRCGEDIKLLRNLVVILCAYVGLGMWPANASWLAQTMGEKSIYSLNKVEEASDGTTSISVYKDGVFVDVNYKLVLNQTVFGDELGDVSGEHSIEVLPGYKVDVVSKYLSSEVKGRYAATNTPKNVEGAFIGLNSPYLSGNYAVGSAVYNWGKKTGITTIDGIFIGNYIENISKPLVWGGAVSLRQSNTESIDGDFIGNYTKAGNSSEATGGAIAFAGAKAGEITGNFISNYVSGGGAYGGAIYGANAVVIDNINANFIGNYAVSDVGSASAGAIEVNWNTEVKNIKGDFVANYANGKATGRGGALGILGTIGEISGDFVGNYAQSLENKALGGAVSVYWENRSGMTIVPSFDSLEGNFIKNYAEGKLSAEGGAIHIGLLGGDVKANFVSNYAKSSYGKAGGGAVSIDDVEVVMNDEDYQSGMGMIEGSFIDNSAVGKVLAQGGALEILGKLKGAISNFYGNYVLSNEGEAKGGAIYLEGEIEDCIRGSFVGNYAVSEDGEAKGGAVYTLSDMSFEVFDADMVIDGNYTISKGEKDDNAFYVGDSNVSLDFKLKNDRSLYLGDNFDGALGYNVNIVGDNKNEVFLFNDIRKADVGVGNIKLNTMDKKAHIYSFNTFNLKSSIDFVGDVDFEKEIMDAIFTKEDSVVENGAKLNVVGLNWLNEPTKDKTSILFVKKDLKNKVVYEGTTKVITPVYVYDIAYKNKEDGGYFEFLRGSSAKGLSGYNPTVVSSGISANVGASGVVGQTLNYSFQNLDNYMNIPFSERVLMACDFVRQGISSGEPLPSFVKEDKASVWMKPYMIDEDVLLKNGAKVSNKTYGTLVGYDTGVKKVNEDWDGAFTGYVGYFGASQDFETGEAHQRGGLLGATLSLYKGNFFNAITLSVGGLETESENVFGKDEYATVLAGVGNKVGYNFEFSDGKFIVQPSLMLGYSYINTEDYKNVIGVKVKNNAAHTLQISPSVRFIFNLDSGWKPYFEVGKVWNKGEEAETFANGVRLPRMYVKPYNQYGIGVQGHWGDKIMVYGQSMLEDGGREGVLVSGGIRWLF